MASSSFAIQPLVKEIKEEMLLNMQDPYSLVSPSAYDTAWLAMLQDHEEPARPLFKGCLDWVLNNQAEEGFWGNRDCHGMPTIESLPATVACIIALKRWNVGKANLDKGLAYIQSNAEKLLGSVHGHCPRWFAITFPAMVEAARKVGLHDVFIRQMKVALMAIFHQRQQILESEELDDCNYQYPLLSYLEALPATYDVKPDDIVKHLSGDGSLFQSPSATAQAFILTGNKKCLSYLQSLVQRCPNGVPSTNPLDEELINLLVVNQLERLGLDEHFGQEIEEILSHTYRSYKNQELKAKPSSRLVPEQLYKDSLAFRILRMHGYSVSPGSFCWFLNHQETRNHIKKNLRCFSSAILNVYKATDLMFPGEYELEDARSFSRKLLEKTLQVAPGDRSLDPSLNLTENMIENELNLPWIARVDHLEHRAWIEDKSSDLCLMGKAFSHRLTSFHNEKLMHLATTSFHSRQSVYKQELEELKRWTKNWGLNEMGFGREKTTYCYFAVAASTSLPKESTVRTFVAKSGILITVADDFFDMEGSLEELKVLTDAVQRWDSNGLSGHSKTIFNALDALVRDTAAAYLQLQGSDITKSLQSIWSETFASWLKEAVWSRSAEIPSMDEYLETGMTSIAVHTLVLLASCLVDPSLPNDKLKPAHYENITKLLMVIARLLNDIQSYEKEEKEGKINSVLLHLRENPDGDIEDSIAYVKEILDKKKKELLQLALMDDFSGLPKSFRHLHLSFLKVFQMFFNSSNRYDSETEMLQDIQKAIYAPLNEPSRPLKPLPPLPSLPPLPLQSGPKKAYQTINSYFVTQNRRRTILAPRWFPRPLRVDSYKNGFMAPKLTLSFI